MKKANAGLMVASQVANSKAGQKAIATTTEQTAKVGKIIGWTLASILVVGAGFLIYKLIIKPVLSKVEEGSEDRASIKETKLVLGELDDIGIRADLTKNFKQMADAIQSALSGWTEDEEAVYTQIRLINNEAEWESLKAAWGGTDGHRDIKGGWMGGGSYDLTSALVTFLNNDERNVINGIFASKNMRTRI